MVRYNFAKKRGGGLSPVPTPMAAMDDPLCKSVMFYPYRSILKNKHIILISRNTL